MKEKSIKYERGISNAGFMVLLAAGTIAGGLGLQWLFGGISEADASQKVEPTPNTQPVDGDPRCGAGPNFPEKGIMINGGGHVPDLYITAEGLNEFLDPMCNEIVAASKAYELDVDEVSALGVRESYVYGFERAKTIESDCGAVGAFQVMPSDYRPRGQCSWLEKGRKFSVERPTREELLGVETNVNTSAKILRYELDNSGNIVDAFSRYYGSDLTNPAVRWYGHTVNLIAQELRNSR